MQLLKSFLLLVSGLTAINAASLTQVTNFGDNPGSVQMYIYVPQSLSPNPAIIVAVIKLFFYIHFGGSNLFY